MQKSAKRAVRPRRPAKPRQPKSAVPHWAETADANGSRAALLAMAIVAVAVSMYVGIGRVWDVRSTPPTVPAPQNDSAVEELLATQTFGDWLGRWQSVDPYVSAAEFSPALTGTFVPEPLTDWPATTVTSPEAGRFVWSDDRSRAVDYLAQYGRADADGTGADSVLSLITSAGSNDIIARCDGGCSFDAAVWLGDDRVAALGRQDVTRLDGSPQCPPGSDPVTDADRCYQRLTIDIFDLTTFQRVTLLSGRHELPTDALAAPKYDRWLAGLTAEERTALKAVPYGETVILDGTIVAIEADTNILSYVSDAGPIGFLTVSPSAVVHDVNGEPQPLSVVEKGDGVTMTASRTSQGMTVFSLKVLNKRIAQ